MTGKPAQLKPQDVLVLLRLATRDEAAWSYPKIAAELGMSASEVHAAVRRGVLAKLAVAGEPKGFRVQVQNLLEFLVHGVRYAFPAVRGASTRGHPTAHAAPVLRNKIVDGEGPPPVWPDSQGTVRGESFSPLYASPTVLRAIVADPAMYEATALVDAIRGGSARERAMATGLLERLLTRKKR